MTPTAFILAWITALGILVTITMTQFNKYQDAINQDYKPKQIRSLRNTFRFFFIASIVILIGLILIYYYAESSQETPPQTPTAVATSTNTPTSVPAYTAIIATTPASAATSIPKPTATPTPTANERVYSATIILDSMYLRAEPKLYSEGLGRCNKGEKVLVYEKVLDDTGSTWLRVEVNDISGYLLSYCVKYDNGFDPFKFTTPKTVTHAPSPTPTPTPKSTVTPTLKPAATPKAKPTPTVKDSAIVTTEPSYSGEIAYWGVYLRSVPDLKGKKIRECKKGESVLVYEHILDDTGSTWLRVEVNGISGYLLSYGVEYYDGDPFKTPTATPSTTPIPTSLLPTTQPMGILDENQSSTDSAHYMAYARAQEGAAAYAVRDFDNDEQMELLLVSVVQNADGTHDLILDIYKLTDGEINRVVRHTYTGALAPGTEIHVTLFQQAEHEVIYFVERSTVSMRPLHFQGMMLTENGFISISLDNDIYNVQQLLLASAGLNGIVTLSLEDCSDPRLDGEDKPADSND